MAGIKGILVRFSDRTEWFVPGDCIATMAAEYYTAADCPEGVEDQSPEWLEAYDKQFALVLEDNYTLLDYTRSSTVWLDFMGEIDLLTVGNSDAGDFRELLGETAWNCLVDDVASRKLYQIEWPKAHKEVYVWEK